MGSTSLEKLNSLVEKELDQLMNKGTLTPPELDTAKKAVELMAEIKEYEAMCMEEMGEGSMYSERSMASRNGRYSTHYPMPYYPMRGSYDSYGNNGGYSEVRRDSMGRYSGHSVKDRMIDRLERMMDEAGSEYERKEIMEEISRLRQSN